MKCSGLLLGSPSSSIAWLAGPIWRLLPYDSGTGGPLESLDAELHSPSAGGGWSPSSGRLLHAQGFDAALSAERPPSAVRSGLNSLGTAGTGTELWGAGARPGPSATAGGCCHCGGAAAVGVLEVWV